MFNSKRKIKKPKGIFNWSKIICLTALIISSSIISPILTANPSDNTEDKTISQSFDPSQKPSFSEDEDSRSKESKNHKKSLIEQFLSTKKRYQPYINLTNQIYDLADLFDPDIFNEYKKLELKSLYLRTNKINLDAKFASEINELVKTGIKEMLILFYQSQPSITIEQFNHFIEENKIYINLMLIPITENDIENIHADSIGKKDILGFKSLDNNKINYTNGYSLTLLNNEETNKIILHNYVEHTRRTTATTSFAVQEPPYITNNNNLTNEKRIKNPQAIKKPFSVEISKNIDLNARAEQQAEEESELYLDREQADNKFDETAAIKRADKLYSQCFYEEDQNKDRDNAGMCIGSLIHSLFTSARDMKFITSKALSLVMQNYFLFQDGIDIDNLPIELAYKDHILFASDQRRSSMPINEFTVKLHPIKPYSSNPVEYSWLPFAAKASISLNDVYGSDVAPKIYGKDEHPAIVKDQDSMLDIPYNRGRMAYLLKADGSFLCYVSYTIKKFFAENIRTSRQKISGVFPNIYFYNLSESDRQKLEEIYVNLQTRGLGEIFSNIVRSENTSGWDSNREPKKDSDGGFLLEEAASLFFKNLFQEILPPSNNEKQKFFVEVLKECKFARNSLPEDVFEGLDGFYKKLKEFMMINEIAPALQEEILAQSISIIKKQMGHGHSFKILLERFINILRLVVARGGSIKEQLEYLDSTEEKTILRNPKQYWKAEKLGLNIIHSSLAISDDDDNKDDLVQDNLIKLISDKDYLKSLNQRDRTLITNSMKYLATFSPHQRPSVVTYSNYFNALSNYKFDLGCYPFIGSKERNSVRVMEYILFDEVYSKYRVKSDINRDQGEKIDSPIVIKINSNSYDLHQGEKNLIKSR